MSYYVVQSLLVLILAYILGAWTGCAIRSWLSYRRYERAYWANPEAFASAIPGPLVSEFEKFSSSDEVLAASKPQSVELNSDETDLAGHIQDRSQEENTKLSDFDLIQGVGQNDLKVLRDNGITSFAEIAAWSAEDVEIINIQLEGKNRVQKENWIEQAALFASGVTTYYADRIRSGVVAVADGEDKKSYRETIDPVPTEFSQAEHQLPEDELGEAKVIENNMTVAEENFEGSVAADQMISEETYQEEVSLAENPPISDSASPGDLEEVSTQADDTFEQDLTGDHLQAIQIRQISESDTSDIESLDEPTHFEERSVNETSIDLGSTEEDKTLKSEVSEGQPVKVLEPEFSDEELSDQVMHEIDITKEEIARAIPGGTAAGIRRPVDNLKRISGIGIIIERRLNRLGIHYYDQIADWTSEEAEVFNEKLEFTGRIEREKWREQAEILSRGGETDFSLKFDRGEVGLYDDED